MALEHWLQLSLTSGLGPILIRRVIEAAGSAENATRMRAADLQQIEGIGLAKAGRIYESLRAAGDEVERQVQAASRRGAAILCPDDPGYPVMLRPLNDRPPVLYVVGGFEPRDLQGMAMVGSRRCSFYGREQADRFASLLAEAGFTVVSGGARGIDSACHRGAMRHPQGRTIAVLGCGLDIAYPPENAELFVQIARRGCLVSEFPFGTPPNAENFPRRNRVISGLSRGVLVIEADERSGALITARFANEEHGRPVFALPGQVDNAMSRGPHQLIRDGAILVTCLEDILAGLDPLPDSATQPTLWDDAPAAAPAVTDGAVVPSLTERQALVLREMGKEPTTVDQLIERTALEAGVILQELTFLSLKGLVKRVDGQSYARAR